MQADDIIFYLSKLGDELEELGISRSDPVELEMIGGGFMLTQVRNRRSTEDVDVLVINPDALADPERYRIFKHAVRFVAYDYKLSEKWLSDNIGDFMQTIGIVPGGKLWKQFGSLRIYIPPADYILALKLVAGRQKDEGNIIALLRRLRIKSYEKAQRILDKCITRDMQDFHDVQNTLDRFF